MEENIDERLLAAVQAAKARFAFWAGMDAPDVPDDPIDAMQVRLARWQVDQFGIADHREMVLGIVEELGETFDADGTDDAIDGLGDVLVYMGQLCISARLSLGPVIDLAEIWHRDPGGAPSDIQPVAAAGRLAHVTLKRQQRIRGYASDDYYRHQLVHVLAMVLVRAVDNVTVNHMLMGGWAALDPRAVYLEVGAQVLQRDWKATPAEATNPNISQVFAMASPEAKAALGASISEDILLALEAPVAEVIEERHLDGTEQEISDAEIVVEDPEASRPTLDLTAEVEALTVEEPAP